MIELKHISQCYSTPGRNSFYALKDVNLTINDGEIFGIIGRSGAGKSTLVRCINLLNRPTEGEVYVDGRNLTSMSMAELRKERRSIGMIFQHFNILSSRTVYDNVAFALELAGMPKAEIDKKVKPLLELVGLTEHADKYPVQLSGGQKQRVGIARALANSPRVLLSDEATSALDPETTVATLELLKKINRELGLTIVMITHQMEVVKSVCSRVAVMDSGRIVEVGDTIDLFHHPKHETTVAMIGSLFARRPAEDLIARVHAKGDPLCHLLHLTFIGSRVNQPLISLASRRFNIDFNILNSQTIEIQGEDLGAMTLSVRVEKTVLEDILKFLEEHSVTVEVF